MINLSIIVPHFESISGLSVLLKSIPKKADIEVLIVDDKSIRDKEKYNKLKMNNQNPNIYFINNCTTKKGPGIARNIGLEKAKGKWVMFADSDDFFKKNFIEDIEEFFSLNYDLIYFTPDSIYADTQRKANRHNYYEKLIRSYKNQSNIQNEMRLRFNYFAPWSKLIRKKVIDDNNIRFSEIIGHEDVCFSTKVGFFASKIYASGKNVYCVTEREGTLSNSMSQALYDNHINVFIERYNFLKDSLPKSCFKLLHLNGMELIVNGIKFKMGFSTVANTYLRLKKNKIKTFSILFNPLFIKDKASNKMMLK